MESSGLNYSIPWMSTYSATQYHDRVNIYPVARRLLINRSECRSSEHSTKKYVYVASHALPPIGNASGEKRFSDVPD